MAHEYIQYGDFGGPLSLVNDHVYYLRTRIDNETIRSVYQMSLAVTSRKYKIGCQNEYAFRLGNYKTIDESFSDNNQARSFVSDLELLATNILATQLAGYFVDKQKPEYLKNALDKLLQLDWNKIESQGMATNIIAADNKRNCYEVVLSEAIKNAINEKFKESKCPAASFAQSLEKQSVRISGEYNKPSQINSESPDGKKSYLIRINFGSSKERESGDPTTKLKDLLVSSLSILASGLILSIGILIGCLISKHSPKNNGSDLNGHKNEGNLIIKGGTIEIKGGTIEIKDEGSLEKDSNKKKSDEVKDKSTATDKKPSVTVKTNDVIKFTSGVGRWAA